MRAIWSFWTKPYKLRCGWEWFSELHHLLSWILSVQTARQHFAETALYTDDEGAALLVDGLGLPFTEVSTALNALHDQDPDWWMLGKLHAYRMQRMPFAHLDSDTYLWKPFPERVTLASVFAQSPEGADPGGSGYNPDLCEALIRSRGDGWIPLEWTWYRTQGSAQMAACCGVLGGNDLDFFQKYAGFVIQILEGPLNRHAFSTLADKRMHNPLFEQYLICACAAYHGVPIEYLFESYEQAIEQAAQAGYTHVIASAKSNPAIARRLEERVAREFPEMYETCRRVLGIRP